MRIKNMGEATCRSVFLPEGGRRALQPHPAPQTETQQDKTERLMNKDQLKTKIKNMKLRPENNKRRRDMARNSS